jgi:S-adenosylmethionine-diacylglycerol 3-amino-3-carboxypropyl transferase
MSNVKFAVVREDPEVEIAVAERVGAARVLLVASGGCTAFALAWARPQAEIVLYDFNPAQLEHVARRAEAIAAGDLARLNVDDDGAGGLSQCGDFERLFRVLRAAFEELVAPRGEAAAWFEGHDASDAPARWRESRYWPALFDLAFTDALLVAMFGPDAVQHAAPGSYPRYFQRAFEGGLAREDARTNPFLQHVLLGRYLGRDAPAFLRARRAFAFPSVLGGVPDVPDLERFDLVHLSNIFDWSSEAAAAAWCASLRRLRPGAAITLRQLNNDRDWRRALAPWFRFDERFGASLLERDRSLFYERLHVGVRTEEPA